MINLDSIVNDNIKKTMKSVLMYQIIFIEFQLLVVLDQEKLTRYLI